MMHNSCWCKGRWTNTVRWYHVCGQFLETTEYNIGKLIRFGPQVSTVQCSARIRLTLGEGTTHVFTSLEVGLGCVGLSWTALS